MIRGAESGNDGFDTWQIRVQLDPARTLGAALNEIDSDGKAFDPEPRFAPPKFFSPRSLRSSHWLRTR